MKFIYKTKNNKTLYNKQGKRDEMHIYIFLYDQTRRNKVNWIQKFYAYRSLQLCSAAKDENYTKGTKYVFGVHLYMFC